jgi:hypothetical protein
MCDFIYVSKTHELGLRGRAIDASRMSHRRRRLDSILEGAHGWERPAGFRGCFAQRASPNEALCPAQQFHDGGAGGGYLAKLIFGPEFQID